MLTEGQRRKFDEDGLVRLPGAVAEADALRIADGIREFLVDRERHVEHPGGLQPLKRAGLFADVAHSAIPDALDDLFGPDGWVRPPAWGQPLVTYRVSDRAWDVPTDSWHIHERSDTLRRINFFTVLGPLRSQGGGTLFLTGSHRLIARLGDPDAKSRTLRARLSRRDRWLAELWGKSPDPAVDRRKRYLDQGAVIDGVPMRVVEASGDPGDTYLMRSDLFHARSPNVYDEPRIMLVGGISLAAGE
jgi:hypothetical protein